MLYQYNRFSTALSTPAAISTRARGRVCHGGEHTTYLQVNGYSSNSRAKLSGNVGLGRTNQAELRGGSQT